VRALYQPRGEAAEYAPLAVNLYRGCPNGCRYCYVPGCLRMPAERFHAEAVPRTGIIEALWMDLRRLRPDGRPVLLSFSSDPYPVTELLYGVTREAVRLLGESGWRVRVLTKMPSLSVRDWGLFEGFGVEFGVSLVWADDSRRAEWEPHADCVEYRVACLRAAKAAGLRTWVSMEPVIDDGEALRVLELAGDCVDVWRIGKLNHHPEIERRIDWSAFLHELLVELHASGSRYYIKNGLWRFACKADREAYGQSVGVDDAPAAVLQGANS